MKASELFRNFPETSNFDHSNYRLFERITAVPGTSNNRDLTVCFGCSKEPSYRDGSFEYPQNMFWLRIHANKFTLGRLQLKTLTLVEK